jgi:hypothetical protein
MRIQKRTWCRFSAAVELQIPPPTGSLKRLCEYCVSCQERGKVAIHDTPA